MIKPMPMVRFWLHGERGSRLGAIVAAGALCVFAAVLPAQNRTSRQPASRNSRTDTRASRLDTTVEVARGIIVDVSANDGDITIRGWDRSEVEVRAESESSDLEFSTSTRTVRLASRRSNGSRGGSATINLRVPLNTRVVVNTTRGEVHVLDVRGEVDAELVSGDVTIHGAAGRTSVRNVSGSIDVTDVNGAVTLSAISGDLTVRDVRGDVNVSSSSGDVSMHGIRANSVQAQVVQGDIVFEGALAPTGRYEFNTHSGDVHLLLDERAKATLRVQSFSGELQSSLPMVLQPDDAVPRPLNSSGRTMSSRSMRLSQAKRLELGGGGGAQVSVSTFNGDVVVSRSPGRSQEDLQQ